MADSEFVHLLRCQWREIAETFWPETAVERARAEIEQRDKELEHLQTQMLRRRQKIEIVRQRLEALDTGLSPPHRAIERLRERLRGLEGNYSRLLARFQIRKRRQAALRKRLLSLPRRESTKEISDPNYSF